MASGMSGAQRRTERLLNLVVYLLGTDRGVTRADLRQGIEDYRETTSDEAFERKFERDKQDLRDLGIPLLTEQGSSGFGDEISYRIDRSGYQLPEVTFTAAERAVLVIAARAWEQAALGSAAAGALRKLGVAGELVPLPPVMTSVETPERSFDAVYAAVRDRTPVSFAYRAAGAAHEQQRHLEPWVLVSRNGSWYVAGHDTDRGEPRVFRLSRIVGDVSSAGAPGSVVVPPSADLRAAAVDLVGPAGDGVRATVRVRDSHGHGLRRRASSVVSDAQGWDTVVIDDVEPDRFAAEVAGYGGDVVVVDPPELRDAVVRTLTAVQGMNS